MHPLLTRLRQLGLYLLAWIPLAAILVYLLTRTSEVNWREGTALILPLCFAYAFLCLSAWYPCRVTPLERAGFSKLLLTHLTGAVLLSTLWMQMAKGLAYILMRVAGFGALGGSVGGYLSPLLCTWVLSSILFLNVLYVML